MNVDFNNLRFQAAASLDRLTRTLNASILKETTSVHLEKQNWIRGDVLFEKEEIQKEIDYLRTLILSICAVYEPGDLKFKDMSTEIFENGGITSFNDTEDEDS